MLPRRSFLAVLFIVAVTVALPERADSRPRCRRRCCTRPCECSTLKERPTTEIATPKIGQSDEERIRGTWQVVLSQFNGEDGKATMRYWFSTVNMCQR